MHIRWNNEQSELEEYEKNITFMLSEARLEIFFKNINNKGPEIHDFALKLYTGATKLYSWAFKLYSWSSKSGGRGGGEGMGPGPLD